MSDQRKLMEKALKDVLVPELRRRGFKGSFPHLRRQLSDRIDFLMIQFYSSGGSFVVEIGRTGPNGFEVGPWTHLPPEKINVGHIGLANRIRIKSTQGRGVDDSWFVFGSRSYDGPNSPDPYAHYCSVALQVIPLLDSQAEPWWASA